MRWSPTAGRPRPWRRTTPSPARLRDELGTDPDQVTAELHLAILRETSLPGERSGESGVARPVLIGREGELASIERAWAAAGSDTAPLLLVVGEAGIGKTRLLDAVADLAAGTGGRVLRGRCHPTERSLFLQPYVDALRPVLLEASPATLADLVRDHASAWVSLVPELAAVLPPVPGLPTDVELQRRQAYDAVAAALRRLALTAPVLLTLDDLQDGGAATVDLLGYLAGHLAGSRVLLVGAVRAEDASVAGRLADRAAVLALGTLPRSAVDALAAAAGLSSHGAQVMARTSGHPLSVVECLRALADGDAGVPESLADAVLTRVGRLDADSRDVVEAAAVLRRRLDPRRLASLVEASEVATARRCEELTRLRLLVRTGERYEFANDLIQECVHASLPPALAAAYHRRAADLTSDQPEEMAEHAYAAGDPARAAQGWLLAGEAALRRAAVEDALGLLDRSVAVPEAATGTRARALLARAARARSAHRLRRRPRRRGRCVGPGPDDRRAPPGDGRPPRARRRRRRRTRASGRRAGRAVGGGAPAGGGSRRPARGGRLQQSPRHPRGQPAPAHDRVGAGRALGGQGQGGRLRGGAGAGARRAEDRVALPGRPRPAARRRQ